MEEEFMRSIDERLIASDPAAAGYEHPRFGAMVARVVATPVSRRDAAWRGFRLKVAAAVAVSGLVTGTGIAALSTAGVSLPVLSFAAGVVHQQGFAASAGSQYNAVSPTKVTASPMMIRPRNFEFTGTDSLSSTTGSSSVYRLVAPSDPVSALGHVASVLGVQLGSAISNDNNRIVSSTGPQYSGTLLNADGVAWWSISEEKQSVLVPTSAAQATNAFDAKALAWASRLTQLQLGSPEATASGPAGPNETGPVQVHVPILIEGRATNLAIDFEFSAEGTLLQASGVDFAVSLTGNYPLLSPAEAVAQIVPQLYVSPLYFGWVAVGGVAGTSSASVGPPTTVSGSSSAQPSVTTVPGGVETTTTTLAPTVVVLDNVSTEFGAYAMANGSTLLLPVYVYSGHDVDTSNPESFRVIPVDPAYLDLSLAVRPQIY
jgi:hypothetical protein